MHCGGPTRSEGRMWAHGGKHAISPSWPSPQGMAGTSMPSSMHTLAFPSGMSLQSSGSSATLPAAMPPPPTQSWGPPHPMASPRHRHCFSCQLGGCLRLICRLWHLTPLCCIMTCLTMQPVSIRQDWPFLTRIERQRGLKSCSDFHYLMLMI